MHPSIREVLKEVTSLVRSHIWHLISNNLVNSSSKFLKLFTPGEKQASISFKSLGIRYAPSTFHPIRISSNGQGLGIRKL